MSAQYPETDYPEKLEAVEFSPPCAQTAGDQAMCFKITQQVSSLFHSLSAPRGYKNTPTDAFEETFYKAPVLFITEVCFLCHWQLSAFIFPRLLPLMSTCEVQAAPVHKHSAGFTHDLFSFLVCWQNCWFFLFSLCFVLELGKDSFLGIKRELFVLE